MRGWWTQLIASRRGHKQTARLADDGAAADSTDSTRTSVSRPQYVAALGWSRNALSLSATARLRSINDAAKTSTMLRGSWDTRRLVLSGTAERRGDLEFTRLEGSARLLPLSFIALSGAASLTSFDDSTITGRPKAWRAETAIRLNQMWIGGGMLKRDPARLIAPVLFDTGFSGTADSSATGQFVHVRGKFWKDVGLDVSGIKWNAERGFRPTYQSRTRLYVDTSWPSRFPSGNLNILAAVTHEYRTQVPFAVGDTLTLRSTQYRTWGLLLEIRLLQATLSYQFRNVLNERYEQVPGFAAVRPVQFYGVRWNFVN